MDDYDIAGLYNRYNEAFLYKIWIYSPLNNTIYYVTPYVVTPQILQFTT